LGGDSESIEEESNTARERWRCEKKETDQEGALEEIQGKELGG
jgi:hypothetical protein